MSDLIGRTLGPYRIIEQLGAGGMATVYKAYHPAMDRYVAIKVLPQHMARDPNFRARFQREARTIARLEHRSILPVHDVGEDDGIHYMVMRYTDGGTLSDLIAGGQLTVARAMRLITQVAEALAYAHRQGVIHRDIKPANVLISREGDALLSDFGIARIIEGTLQLTSEGMLIGTPFYMAPEQVQGQPADARTDIYALGVVLYEVLTGRRPFEAETPLAVALMHIHNPLPPPRQIRPELPEACERIILRAMAKSPADRFQTADEMAEALHAWERDTAPTMPGGVGDIPASPATPPPAVPPIVTPVPTTTPNTPSPKATIVIPEQQPAPARPAPRLALWIGAGAVALLLIAGLAYALVGRGGPSNEPSPEARSTAPVPAAAGALPADPTTVPREDLQVLSNTSMTYALGIAGGAIWATTDGGLVRFDGDDQRVFTAADGLPFTSIRAMQATSDGTLWLAGESDVARVQLVADGLGRIDHYTESQGLGIFYVRAFLKESDGSILAGGYLNSGLVRFDGVAWHPFDLPLDNLDLGNPSGDIMALARGPDDALYIGSTEALLRWDGQTLTRYSEEQGVGGASITGLLADESGSVWAAAGDLGLLRLNPDEQRWERVPVLADDLAIHTIVQLTGGRLWATSWELLVESTDGGATWTRVPAEPDTIGYAPRSIVEDATGRIWVGTTAGVSRRSGEAWQRFLREGEIPQLPVGRLIVHEDRLWVTAHYGGAVAAVSSDGTVEVFDGPYARSGALAFYDGVVWVGNDDGLFRVQDGQATSYTTADGLPSNHVRSLLIVDTMLWIGTEDGLVAYDLEQEQLVSLGDEFKGAIVTELLHAPDGSVWAGTNDDGDPDRPVLLGRYDGSSWEIWRVGDPPLTEEARAVTALAADREGRIWVATWNGGLHRWDGERWGTLSTANAPEGNILALAEHDGAIFAAGNLGALFRWTEAGWERIEIDGLPGQVNALAFDDKGAIVLGTSEGLYRYAP